MTINHNDVYDFLHGLRKELGIDLISHPKMAQMHGKTYPTVGNTLHLDETDGWGSINIRIPHENGYLTEIHSNRTGSFRRPEKQVQIENEGKFSANLVPSQFSTSLVNDMIPGTYKTKSGLTRNTFNVGKSGENREGPYFMSSDGIMMHNSTGAKKHFHDFIKDISNKASPDGTSHDYYPRSKYIYYPGSEDKKAIPRNQMKDFGLLDAVGHMREWDLGMTMPKGTEHHLGVASIGKAGGPSDNIEKYLYDIGSESLTEVPEEMHTKSDDVS